MQKKYLYLASLLALTAIAATGCKKKEETPAMPTEQTLTAVTVNDLQAGSYYVKNAGDFYELPLEGISFDATKAVTSTDDTGNGMTRPEENRIVDYVYKDGAILCMGTFHRPGVFPGCLRVKREQRRKGAVQPG